MFRSGASRNAEESPEIASESCAREKNSAPASAAPKGAAPKAAAPAEAAPQAEAGDASDMQAIQEGAEAFVTAYNAHDAKALAALFALKAEFTDEVGNLIKGREAIEQDFTKQFTENPECAIDIEIDSIRVLTPNVALEEGFVHGQPAPEEPVNISSYVAIHVKVNGKWHVASVSDYEIAAEPTPHERLQDLAWMVGDWLDESPGSSSKTSCRWDESGNFLLHEFKIQIAGMSGRSGSMRIGWDPLAGRFKSWTFDVDGGHAEGEWTLVGEEWVVKSRGVNAAGQTTSAMSVFRFIDNDTMTWRSYDRFVGGEKTDDIPVNHIKRQAPPPAS